MPPDFELWLDTHISPIIAKWLKDDFGYNCKSAFVLNLYGLNDLEIYKKAKAAGNIIILSKDSDLIQIVEEFGSPPKVISLGVGNTENRVLYGFLKERLEHSIRLLTQFKISHIRLTIEQ